MINLTKLRMLLAIVALTSTVAIAIPTMVSAQNMTAGNMTGNMTGAEGGENMTADINQTGSISGRSGIEVDIIDITNPSRPK